MKRLGVLASLWILLFSIVSNTLNARLAVGPSTLDPNCEFFGVGEPLTYRSAWSAENLSVNTAFGIMQSLGICRLREWVWRWMIFNEDGTRLRQNIAEALNKTVMEALSRNITVLGMAQDFPSWMTGIEDDRQAIPFRNLTEGSPYKRFLEVYETSWETLARTFPNISMWEIGNECNLPEFLHPPVYKVGNSNTWFDYSETVDITTDLLFYGSQGILTGNPKATTVMCGLAPGGNGIGSTKDFLKSIYKNIESGKWPSTDPDDFFQVACWHPYIHSEKPNMSNWVKPNTAVYNVMVNHGDGDKPVVFSEFGYSDNCTDLNDTQIAEYLKEAFTLAFDNYTPWLEAIYWFRLIDPDPRYDGKLPCKEYGFGLVKSSAENYSWKPAAHAYKEIVLERETPPEFPSTVILLVVVGLLLATVFTTLAIVRRRKRLSKTTSEGPASLSTSAKPTTKR